MIVLGPRLVLQYVKANFSLDQWNLYNSSGERRDAASERDMAGEAMWAAHEKGRENRFSPE